MNRFFISFAFILATTIFSSHAQLNDFNLSDYKLPDLDRRVLETRFSLNGSNYYDKSPMYSLPNFKELNQNQYGSSAFLNYNHYLNNTKYQRNSNYAINFNSNYYNRKQDGELFNKSNQMSPALYIQTENRRYFEGGSFIEADLDISYEYSSGKSYSKNYWDSSENNNTRQNQVALIYVPLKIGKGRIEHVQDARQAVYILDELAKVDRMLLDKTDEQVLEFAKHISQLKNKRFFDARLKRMAEIESLDSFLVSKDYLLKSDAKYFTTLTDFWDYGNRPTRSSGTRYSGAMVPGYYYNNYKNTENKNTNSGTDYYESIYKLNSLFFDAGFELKYEKPINLLWQNTIDFSAFAGIIEGNLEDNSDYSFEKLRIPNIKLEFSQTVGFYPNTRTDIRLGYRVQYVQLFDKSDIENEIIGVEGKGAKAATTVAINYYISPKLRLNFNSSIYYIWQESVDEVVFNFDNLAGSNYLLNSSNFDPNSSSGYFKEREFRNTFDLSLIYTIF